MQIKFRTMEQKNKCIFLDRDGVLNKDRVDYVYRMEDLIIFDEVAESLKMLKDAGYLLIVITNQSGISKGLFTETNVWNIYNKMQEVSENALDDMYFCKHHPKFTGVSLCRKPDSLMIEKAIAKYNIDPELSWMIGDKESDIQAGLKAQVRTIHIDNGKEKTNLAHFSVPDILAASKLILAS
jgi:D-glycero-D-manno-heptose 1,7-bisphosphate phosphatase